MCEIICQVQPHPIIVWKDSLDDNKNKIDLLIDFWLFSCMADFHVECNQ